MTLEELSIRFTADAGNLKDALNELSDLSDSLQNRVSLLQQAFYSAGTNASRGLQQGILSQKGAVVSAAKELADAARAALEGALEIHSPSRVTMRLGQYFTKGFANGIEEGQSDAANSAKNLSLEALQGLQTGQNTQQSAPPSGDMQIIIPLEIDGVEIARAAAGALEKMNQAKGDKYADY